MILNQKRYIHLSSSHSHSLSSCWNLGGGRCDGWSGAPSGSLCGRRCHRIITAPEPARGCAGRSCGYCCKLRACLSSIIVAAPESSGGFTGRCYGRLRSACRCRRLVFASKPARRLAGGSSSGSGRRFRHVCATRGRLVQASPPAGSLTRRCTCPCSRGCGGNCRRGCLSAVALVHFPGATVSTIRSTDTFGNRVVFENDIGDDSPNLVRANTNSPPLVRHNIIDTLIASVAGRFHGIASKRARSSCSIACTDVYWVCGVAKVIRPCVGSCLWCVGVGSRRNREAQSRSRKCFWYGLKGYGG